MEKLYADEDFPKPTVLFLREIGYDVLTMVDAGQANKGVQDADVLAFAVSQERVLLTLNRFDFIRIHHANPQHYGIIVCTRDGNFEALAQRVDKMLTENRNDCSCKLLRVYKPA